jgi:hypothetical protein
MKKDKSKKEIFKTVIIIYYINSHNLVADEWEERVEKYKIGGPSQTDFADTTHLIKLYIPISEGDSSVQINEVESGSKVVFFTFHINADNMADWIEYDKEAALCKAKISTDDFPEGVTLIKLDMPTYTRDTFISIKEVIK